MIPEIICRKKSLKMCRTTENIYKTIIPRNVRLAEAPSYGMPITSYAPDSTGAEAYRQLALEMVAHEL